MLPKINLSWLFAAQCCAYASVNYVIAGLDKSVAMKKLLIGYFIVNDRCGDRCRTVSQAWKPSLEFAGVAILVISLWEYMWFFMSAVAHLCQREDFTKS